MNNFGEKFKFYFSKRKQRLSVSGSSISKDWIGILIFGGIILIVGMIFSYFLFTSIANETIFETTVVDVPVVESENKGEKIEQVVEYLLQR